MDGIFGVGLAEIVLVGLVLFIIGGPKNTLVWARELGRWVRRVREEYSRVLASFEQELGSEGKEVLDAVRGIGQEVQDLRGIGSPQTMIRNTLRSEVLSGAEPTGVAAKSAEASAAAVCDEAVGAGKVYPAWVPPDSPHTDQPQSD